MYHPAACPCAGRGLGESDHARVALLRCCTSVKPFGGVAEVCVRSQRTHGGTEARLPVHAKVAALRWMPYGLCAVRRGSGGHSMSQGGWAPWFVKRNLHVPFHKGGCQMASVRFARKVRRTSSVLGGWAPTTRDGTNWSVSSPPWTQGGVAGKDLSACPPRGRLLVTTQTLKAPPGVV